MSRRLTVAVRVSRRLLALGVGLFMVGCAQPRATVDPAGRLPVLGPVPGFSISPLPEGWLIDARAILPEKALALAEKQGVPALKVSGGAASFILARRTRVVLLASPFLSWSWAMDMHGAGTHPIGLIIGFRGGNRESSGWGNQPLAWLGSRLPPHDRTMTLIWDESALARGHLARPTDRDGKTARYTVRGGRENTGTWWLETVDLSALYGRAWPGDDIGRAQVVFIGVAARRTARPVAGYFSGIVLSR